MSYQSTIKTGEKERDGYDSFMSFLGQGIGNENYVPGVDADGNVKPLTIGERLSGISMAEKEAANAKIQLRAAKKNPNFQYLEAQGVMTSDDLGEDVSTADLAKKTEDFKTVKTAANTARLQGLDPSRIEEVRNSGLSDNDIATTLLTEGKRAAADQKEEDYKNSTAYKDLVNEREHRRERERIADARLAFDRNQAAQLRRDQLIENKEARLGNQELAMLKLNLEENKHNQNLQYQRELDRRKSTENIAAALSSLAMGFFA